MWKVPLLTFIYFEQPAKPCPVFLCKLDYHLEAPSFNEEVLLHVLFYLNRLYNRGTCVSLWLKAEQMV